MNDFQFFLKWLSENSCLSVVLFWLLMEGLVGIAKYLRRPTLRATDAEDSAPSKAVSNAETLSNSDGSAVPTRRS